MNSIYHTKGPVADPWSDSKQCFKIIHWVKVETYQVFHIYLCFPHDQDILGQKKLYQLKKFTYRQNVLKDIIDG